MPTKCRTPDTLASFSPGSDSYAATQLPLPNGGSVAKQQTPPRDHSGENAMAVNLTSIVTQFLTPEVIAQNASFLGLDRSAAQKAVAAAGPTMLAGLSDVVGTPAGVSQLSKLLSQQQGNAADLLRNSGAQGLAQ